MCPSDGKVIDIDLEKKALDQLERSVQKEEMEAQISRERMSSIRDQVQVRVPLVRVRVEGGVLLRSVCHVRTTIQAVWVWVWVCQLSIL